MSPFEDRFEGKIAIVTGGASGLAAHREKARNGLRKRVTS
jgi:hypothetical protein